MREFFAPHPCSPRDFERYFVKKVIAIAVVALVCTSAFAITGFLRSQSTSGQNKYCTYSNGVIITISAVELCPLSID